MSKIIQHDLFKVKADSIMVLNAFRSDILTLLKFYGSKMLEELKLLYENNNDKGNLQNLKNFIFEVDNVKQCIKNRIAEDDKSGAHSRVFQIVGEGIFINLIKAVGGLDAFLQLYQSAEYDDSFKLRVLNTEKIENINARYVLLPELDCDYSEKLWQFFDSGDYEYEEGLDIDIENSFINMYRRAVEYADLKGFASLAIPVYEPCLLGGSWIMPFQVCQTAVDQDNGFSESKMQVYITLYEEIYTQATEVKYELSRYINGEYIKANEVNQTFATGEKYVPILLPAIDKDGKRAKTFVEVLNDYIERYTVQNHKKVSDIYNKISLDRRAFSLYKSGKEKPSKRKIIELAIALNLPLADAERFLQSAGYVFLESDTAERILKQNIAFSCYDIVKINDELYRAGIEKLIGCTE